MPVGQDQWYQFGVGAPPILVCFGRDWDVHWGYVILTHGQMCEVRVVLLLQLTSWLLLTPLHKI